MNDPFGEALMAYIEGGTKVHEIERDDGKVDEVDTGWYFASYSMWRPVEQEIAGHALGKGIQVP